MSTGDYPRMLFHRQKPPVIVQSEAEEAALGAEWSRSYRKDEHQDPPADMRMPAAPEERSQESEVEEVRITKRARRF
jgi:hypothetical protein